MKRTAVLLLLLVCLHVAAGAVEFHELGLRVGLALQPFLLAGRPHWEFSLAAYTRVTLSDQYDARVVLGTAAAPFRPFADVYVSRPMSDEWTLEGKILLEIVPGRSIAATTAVGTRLSLGELPDVRWEVASFPLEWGLEVRDTQVLGHFLLRGNLMLDVTLAGPSPFLIGQGLRLDMVRTIRSTQPPLISIGSGWALGIDLLTRLGANLDSEP